MLSRVICNRQKATTTLNLPHQAKDNDGLTALAVAMEAGHRDAGVLLYANMTFSRGSSPYSSMKIKKSSGSGTTTPNPMTPTAAGSAAGSKVPTLRSPIPPTPPLRTRRNSNTQ